MSNRIETDLIGELEVPSDALYGIHAVRAVSNFAISHRPVKKSLIHSYGAVKLASAKANHELGRWDAQTFDAIEAACQEMMDGKLDEWIVVDALQGGAGTSTNLNVSEVLCNRALSILGDKPGNYERLSPTDDLNLHQSTNDTYPTALKVAAIFELRKLEKEVVGLQEAFQEKEKEFASIVKIGRTELQDAALTTLGRSMGAYADPLSRDRWRIYKCEERLRVVNLGGTAIGTGLGAPTKYIFRATDILRQITGIGVARAENLIDATQNTDAIVETSGILKALSTTLIKISNDLRLLSSGPTAGIGEIILPVVQAGSSIMPGKVNPVIPEATAQAAIMALGLDQTLSVAASMANLELSQFMPLIADCLLEEIELLTEACRTLCEKCVRGIMARKDRCRAHIDSATALSTALVSEIGYEEATKIAKQADLLRKSVRETAIESGLITAERFDELIAPEAVTKLGS
jgi:aspartate ammonia-lyase